MTLWTMIERRLSLVTIAARLRDDRIRETVRTVSDAKDRGPSPILPAFKWFNMLQELKRNDDG